MKSSTPFPPANYADEQGLLAIGGDLSSQRLISAYYKGIFPWYDQDQPILWFSPDPRMVLYTENLKISKSMNTLLKKKYFTVSFNADFKAVIENCASIYRPGQQGTWIHQDMKEAYIRLHKLGYAYSVEVWNENELVGGLYGIWLKDKGVFCGESMFAKESNASKYGFVKWVHYLKSQDTGIIDCQVYTEHLASLGAIEINRDLFLSYLN